MLENPPFFTQTGNGAPGAKAITSLPYFDISSNPATQYVYYTGAWHSLGGSSAAKNATIYAPLSVARLPTEVSGDAHVPTLTFQSGIGTVLNGGPSVDNAAPAVRGFIGAAPVIPTPWYILMQMNFAFENADYLTAGFLIKRTLGSYDLCGFQHDNSITVRCNNYLADLITYNGERFEYGGNSGIVNFQRWLGVGYDGVNISYYVSPDGGIWNEIYSGALGAGDGVANVGVGIYAGRTAVTVQNDVIMNIQNWVETPTAPTI